jgi:uncharacterized protein YjbI with pentapeptide repeats
MIVAAVHVLGQLIAAGVSLKKAYGGHDLKEQFEALEKIVTAGESVSELTHKKPAAATAAARQLGLIACAFGEAWRRHWAYSEELAPKDLERRWSDYLFESRGDRTRKEYVARALERVVGELQTVGDFAGASDITLADRMLGDPVNTPYYRSLWSAFTDPTDPALDEALVCLSDDGARVEFERHFRLAYAEGLASPIGVGLRDLLAGLKTDRANVVLQLVVRDIARWGERHVFGNVEQHESLPPMPLDAMYVEPFARLVEDEEEKTSPRPARTYLRELLTREPIILVTADFGHGKSLTARALARDLAREYLTSSEPGPSVPLPVFVRCVDDLTSQDLDVRKIVHRALWRHAKLLGLTYKLDDEAFRGPPQDWRAVFFLDGLDEVSLTENELHALFERLREESSDRHRFVILSRPAILPRREHRRGLPELQLLPLSARGHGKQRGGQIAEWLTRYAATVDGTTLPTVPMLQEHGLLAVAEIPILLFMIAHTWHSLREGAERPTQATIYETFIRQIARGKHDADLATNRSVAEASRKLMEQLAQLGELDDPDDPVEAMLWLMGRLAWESRRLRTGEALSEYHITKILRDELDVHDTEHTERVIRLGVLLALQANLGGTARRILFGHKSFVEYLVARHWRHRLTRIARARGRERERLEADLGGGRLLGHEDRAFEFLSQMLARQGDNERAAIREWAEDCFRDEHIEGVGRRHATLRGDRRSGLREAALAIGSTLSEHEGVAATDPYTLRTMLASFWVSDVAPIVVAPRFASPGAILTRAPLVLADLRGANLMRAQLAAADLYRARLSGADLTEASLENAKLRRADLTGAKLTRAKADEARFNNANLRQADLRDASLVEVDLTRCNASEASFEGAKLMSAQLEEAKLIGAKLAGANLTNARLRGADLSGAVLRDAQLINADLRGARLDGADLSGAKLDGADLTGASTTNVVWTHATGVVGLTPEPPTS